MSVVPERKLSSNTVPETGLYRHFKGGEYELLSVARHSETEELLVVYRPVGSNQSLWVRPLDMFTEVIDRPDGPTPRFVMIQPVRRPRLKVLSAVVSDFRRAVARPPLRHP